MAAGRAPGDLVEMIEFSRMVRITHRRVNRQPLIQQPFDNPSGHIADCAGDPERRGGCLVPIIVTGWNGLWDRGRSFETPGIHPIFSRFHLFAAHGGPLHLKVAVPQRTAPGWICKASWLSHPYGPGFLHQRRSSEREKWVDTDPHPDINSFRS